MLNGYMYGTWKGCFKAQSVVRRAVPPFLAISSGRRNNLLPILRRLQAFAKPAVTPYHYMRVRIFIIGK